MTDHRRAQYHIRFSSLYGERVLPLSLVGGTLSMYFKLHRWVLNKPWTLDKLHFSVSQARVGETWSWIPSSLMDFEE
jgi:hypothetical protein